MAEPNEYVTRFVSTRASRLDVAENELTGFPIVFNSLSLDLGGFKERIAPSAVDRTLREGSDVLALQDHKRETTSILGSTDSGSLTLTKDATGLRAKITPPNTTNARDLIQIVKAGLARGMSFSFRVMPDGQTWEELADGTLLRTITDMVFSEISVVISPAYLSTSISARNAQLDHRALAAYVAAQNPWKPSMAFRDRLVRAGLSTVARRPSSAFLVRERKAQDASFRVVRDDLEQKRRKRRARADKMLDLQVEMARAERKKRQ